MFDTVLKWANFPKHHCQKNLGSKSIWYWWSQEDTLDSCTSCTSYIYIIRWKWRKPLSWELFTAGWGHLTYSNSWHHAVSKGFSWETLLNRELFPASWRPLTHSNSWNHSITNFVSWKILSENCSRQVDATWHIVTADITLLRMVFPGRYFWAEIVRDLGGGVALDWDKRSLS